MEACSKNHFPVDLHALLAALSEGLLIILMRLHALLLAGIRCELPCHHLGENPEPF